METEHGEKSLLRKIRDYFKWYFTISDDIESKEAIIRTIKEGVSFRGTTIMILIAAMFIASLGLNVNSAAVIIGAMLISPLMGPIMGLGLGVGIYDYPLIKRSLRNLAMAALFSIIASTVYFLLSPLNEERSELLARTSPTIYDVLIAFFGGCAGILGVASKQKGNVLPGVAIATALMPPLCTAGYGIATLQLSYFLGAFYLFLINSIFIGIATTIGVRFFRFPKVKLEDERSARRVSHIVYTIIVATILPSIFLTISMLRDNRFINAANSFVDKEFVFPNTQVIKRSAEVADGKRVIKVSLIGHRLPLDSLRLAMHAKMEAAGLGNADLEITQGFSQGEIDINKLSAQMFGEIINANQQRIRRQEAEIDSLRLRLSKGREKDSLTVRLAEELKVVFPQVDAISLDQGFFARKHDTAETGTVNLAIVTLHSSLSAGQEAKLTEFLEARTGLPGIRLIKYNAPQLFAGDTIRHGR